MPTVQESVKAFLEAVAATLAPVPAVRAGETSLLGAAPMLTYWFSGFPTWQSNSMAYTQRIERWGIRASYPIPATLESGSNDAVEAWMVAATKAVEAQFWGDVSLAGASTGKGALLGEAQPGWVEGTSYRVVTWQLDAYLSQVTPIASST